MTKEYLVSKGWRLIGTRRCGSGAVAQLWAHDDYQRDDGRFFTKHEAVCKQMHIEKPWKHPDIEVQS